MIWHSIAASSSRGRGAAAFHEIMAITGHQTAQMAKTYTKKVEQKQLAASAIRKLERGEG